MMLMPMQLFRSSPCLCMKTRENRTKKRKTPSACLVDQLPHPYIRIRSNAKNRERKEPSRKENRLNIRPNQINGSPTRGFLTETPSFSEHVPPPPPHTPDPE